MVDASLKENSAVSCGARCPLSAISAVDQVLKIAACIHTSMRTPCDEAVIRFGARILRGDEDADSRRTLGQRIMAFPS